MGVSYLLDTHILLWLLGEPERVPQDVRTRLASRSNRLLVSSISALEIATKTRLGKLEASPLLDAWSERLRELAAEELELSARHALLAGSLRWDHRDPFDRVLVAQATIENLTLVTTDAAIVAYPGIHLTTW